MRILRGRLCEISRRLPSAFSGEGIFLEGWELGLGLGFAFNRGAGEVDSGLLLRSPSALLWPTPTRDCELPWLLCSLSGGADWFVE